jgi:uncharacterized protein
VKYLIDSNVLLEAFLGRARWQEAGDFLARVMPTDVGIADFSLHSMGFYLARKTPDIFDEILQDVISRGTAVLRIEPAQLFSVTENVRRHRLDFDDAFVYTIAESHDLTIVSLDSDFDHTPRGRKTPSAALAS